MQFKLLQKVQLHPVKSPKIIISSPTNRASISSAQMSPQINGSAAAVAAFLAFSAHLCFPTTAHLFSPDTPLLEALSDLIEPAFPFCPLTFSSASTDHQYGCKYNPLCDDFPPDFPPPDTPAVSVFCVDPNGCCDFTTVQAAVDAIPDHSRKRNVVWINKGIYL
jgi:hypothetical protein